MTGLWAKLNLKDQREIVVLNAPGSFAPELKALGRVRVNRSIADQTRRCAEPLLRAAPYGTCQRPSCI